MKKRKKRITVPVIMQMEALECGAASPCYDSCVSWQVVTA